MLELNTNRGHIVLPNNPTKKNMSELDQYAEFLKRKIKLEFPNNKDIRIKNDNLTLEQLDYLQLKLDIHIWRLSRDTIIVRPQEKACIVAENTRIDKSLFLLAVILAALACIFTILNLLGEKWSITVHFFKFVLISLLALIFLVVIEVQIKLHRVNALRKYVKKLKAGKFC